jgi:hypothetical protein
MIVNSPTQTEYLQNAWSVHGGDHDMDELSCWEKAVVVDINKRRRVHSMINYLSLLIAAIAFVGPITPFICAGGLLVLTGLGIYTLLKRYIRRAVKRALGNKWLEEWQAEMERHFEAWQQEDEQKRQQRLRLDDLWGKVYDLQWRLRGTNRVEQEELWEMHWEYGTSVPQKQVPENRRPLDVELQAITRVLTHVGFQLEFRAIDPVDIEFYEAWVRDIEFRYSLFEWQNSRRQEQLLRDLTRLRTWHVEIGKSYCLSSFNQAYLRFPGMLHVLETLITDEAPTEPIIPLVEVLDTQLNQLVSRFDRGNF